MFLTKCHYYDILYSNQKVADRQKVVHSLRQCAPLRPIAERNILFFLIDGVLVSLVYLFHFCRRIFLLV